MWANSSHTFLLLWIINEDTRPSPALRSFLCCLKAASFEGHHPHLLSTNCRQLISIIVKHCGLRNKWPAEAHPITTLRRCAISEGNKIAFKSVQRRNFRGWRDYGTSQYKMEHPWCLCRWMKEQQPSDEGVKSKSCCFCAIRVLKIDSGMLGVGTFVCSSFSEINDHPHSQATFGSFLVVVWLLLEIRGDSGKVEQRSLR